MTRRRFVQQTLCLAAPTLLTAGTGCRPRENSYHGKTVLRYMAWGNPEQIATEREIVAEFEKQNPDIRVHLFMVPGSAYTDKLQLMLASRTAPDVLRADHYYFPALARKNYFLALDDFIAQEPEEFLEDIVPAAVEEGLWDGKLYGMNVLFGPMMIYFNKNLFDAEGLPDPYTLHKAGKWNWETFVRTAQALTRRDSNDRAVQFGSNMVGFPLYTSVIWNHGGVILNEDRTRFVMDQDPGAIAGMQEYANLRWKYRCAPTPADNALSAFTFESGKIAMHWGWSGESPRFRKNIKSFAWDLAPTPSGPVGSDTVIKGNQLCIYRESPHPEAAWRFVKFMTGPTAEMILGGQLRRSVPTRLSVQNDPRYHQTEQPPFHTDIFIESVRRGRTLPIDWRYQEWSVAFNSATESLFNVNNRDAKAALADAATRVNAVLQGEEGF
ncbi:MAG: hypothetical protein OHK0029_24360 [Armatimonadaceae bacterium]